MGSPVVFFDFCLYRFNLMPTRIHLDRVHHGMIVQIGYVVRFGSHHSGFRFLVLDMPICIVGEVPEFQCQFVMAITLGVIVIFLVLSQHETVDDRPVAQSLGVVGYIVSFHLNVGAVGYAIFESVCLIVRQSGKIQFPVRFPSGPVASCCLSGISSPAPCIFS